MLAKQLRPHQFVHDSELTGLQLHDCILRRCVLANKFLCSTRPAEAAIAKVFAKIRQNILFCKFLGRVGRTGTSRTTNCQNSALNDPWRYQKHQKKRIKKSEFFTISGFSFSSFLIDFGGARLVSTSKSSSLRFFALDGQFFRSVTLRRLELIFGFFTVRTSTCGEIYGEGVVASRSRNDFRRRAGGTSRRGDVGRFLRHDATMSHVLMSRHTRTKVSTYTNFVLIRVRNSFAYGISFEGVCLLLP